MKKFFAVAALIASVNAFACPDLAGTWECRGEDGSVSTSQVSQNGYTINIQDPEGNMEIIADGQVRTVEMDVQGTMISGYSRAWCQGDQLLYAQAYPEQQNFPAIEMLISIGKRSATTLGIQTQIGRDGQVQTISMDCTKR